MGRKPAIGETREGYVELTIRKSGELLKTMLLHQDLQVRVVVVFDAENRLRQFLWELPQLFCCPGPPEVLPLLPIRGSTAAIQLWICAACCTVATACQTGANPVRDRRRNANLQSLPGAAAGAKSANCQVGKGVLCFPYHPPRNPAQGQFNHIQKEKNKMKKLLAIVFVLVMVLSLVACGGTETPEIDPSENQNVEPSGDAAVPAGKSFTVVVTDLDGSETTFEYTSEAATVGEALLAEGLIAGDESDWGLMVTTVNGITADWATENAYWAFYIDGAYAETGVDATELTDGATYSFVKTVSYTVLGEGATTFYFTAKDLDGTVTKYEIHTDAATVGEALAALEVIAGDESDWGLMVTTVNGITADWDTECAYWAFYIDGEYAMTGVDATEITAGATYEMVKTISYTVLGEGATTIYVTVQDVDGTVSKFQVNTDAATVGEALLAVELIAGDESDWGLMVTTVNGITADWDTESAYWAFYIGDVYAETGVDATDIVAGTTYTFVKTISE